MIALVEESTSMHSCPFDLQVYSKHLCGTLKITGGSKITCRRSTTNC